MRKLLRSIARTRMQKEGIQHINKPLPNLKGGKGQSFFAKNWRDYIN